MWTGTWRHELCEAGLLAAIDRVPPGDGQTRRLLREPALPQRKNVHQYLAVFSRIQNLSDEIV